MSQTWWRGAAIYQVYLRSFADGNGDGIGDLAGLRSRLTYLKDLGVDAIWLNPWYPSPMADGGYDVADYRDIEPVFGTLEEAEAFIAEAHALDIKVIIDVVPNHSSTESAWFKEALADRRARDRFWFRDEPDNDWRSIFGGPAWTQVADGQWYLHLFAPEQPDFNWDNPEVHQEFEDVLRFWFDRGVDGFRIDSAALLFKSADGYEDLDGVHDVYRRWREVADEYGGRVLIGEVWLPDQERFARYLRPDELHTAFNFDFLSCPWEPAALRRVIDLTLATHTPIGAPPTWVLSNHDVTRPVTRYGRADTAFEHGGRLHGTPSDLELGYRRARAAALLAMALPGSVYVYQGEELGLPEVEDLPDEVRQDPMYARSGGTNPGRDGCRVPLPWSGDGPPFGFGPGPGPVPVPGPGTGPGTGAEAGAGPAAPWLPQPEGWRKLTAEAQAGDLGSMLNLYRSGLALRRDLLGDGTLTWLPSAADVLAFARDSGLACVANLGRTPVPLPPGQVVLSSGPLDEGELPPDTTAWVLPPGSGA